MSFNREEFLRRAIQIPSDDDITEMQDFLVETLVSEGYAPDIDEQRNILVTRESPGADTPHLVLNTHIDTVPPHIPYERDGDILKGRGACDAKGPLTSILDAFFSATISDGQLTLAITSDEETAQFGGFHLGETLTADGYIVGEPTGLDVCTAARGNFGGQVTIFGESAHASDPSAGTNPLRAVGSLLDALEHYDQRCGPQTHEFLGPPTLVPTRIDCGGPLNQTPSKCTICFDRRTIPPETIDGFVANLETYLANQISEEYKFQVEPAYPESPAPEAFATDHDSEIVKILSERTGGRIRPFEAATEASYFADNGPVVLFGPGVLADETGPVAHSNREYLKLSAVKEAGTIVEQTIETLL